MNDFAACSQGYAGKSHILTSGYAKSGRIECEGVVGGGGGGGGVDLPIMDYMGRLPLRGTFFRRQVCKWEGILRVEI